MELLYLVGTIWVLLLLSLAMCFDTRRPMSTKLTYKYRVGDDSIFRKIFIFKGERFYTCNYFKIVPFYVFLLLAISSSILLLIDIFANGFISHAVSKEVFTIVMLSILVSTVLYFLVVNIWWEIVDYNEFKFTKEEKEKLKQLRKLRKENKKNSK